MLELPMQLQLVYMLSTVYTALFMFFVIFARVTATTLAGAAAAGAWLTAIGLALTVIAGAGYRTATSRTYLFCHFPLPPFLE
jgi:hypothetical protein